MAVARSFWMSGRSGRRLAPSKVRPRLAYTSAIEGEVQFYVFNNGLNGGFVVVGGDECAHEILGYGNEGSFDYDSAPANVKWWLSEYRKQIHRAIAQGATRTAERRMAPPVRLDVEPLVKTQWNQSAPYNSELPSLGAAYTGSKALATGCLATAMAQIMNYHQYPSTGVGSKSYDKTFTDPAKTVTFEADFGATNYAWTDMLDDYESAYTDAQREAVARLMYHCGVSVNTDYNSFDNGGSGADTRKAGNALVDYFGYDQGLSVNVRNLMTDDDWEELIYSELSAKRPVLYGGQSEVVGAEGGHAFVCDGYRSSDQTFHINWGWGGNFDGYFHLTGTDALKPGGSGSGGAGDNAQYSSYQEALTGIQPETGNPVAENIVVTNFGLDMTEVARGGHVNAAVTFYNFTYCKLNIHMGLKLTEQGSGDEYVYPFDMQIFETSPNGGYELDFDNHVAFGLDYIDEGTYDAVPVFKNHEGEWQEMKLAAGVTVPTISVTAPDDLYMQSRPTFGNNDFVTPDDHTLNLRIKNGAAEDKSARIIVFIFHRDYSSSIGYFDASTVTFPAGEVKELNLSNVSFSKNSENVPYKFETGQQYTIRVMDYTNSKTLLGEWNVYINVVEPANISYTLSDNGWGTICLPFEAEVPEGLKVYAVSSHDGPTLSYNEADHIAMNTPYVVSGTPDTYLFNGPSTTPGTYSAGLLTGTTADDASIPVGSYILQNQASHGFGFYRTDAARTAAQYRAYITLHGAVTVPFLGFDEATGIKRTEDTEKTEATEGAIYNLSGQRLNSLQKGINIVNGKKILVK